MIDLRLFSLTFTVIRVHGVYSYVDFIREPLKILGKQIRVKSLESDNDTIKYLFFIFESQISIILNCIDEDIDDKRSERRNYLRVCVFVF